MNEAFNKGLRDTLVDIRCARIFIDPENKNRFHDAYDQMLTEALEDPAGLEAIAAEDELLTELLEQDLIREIANSKRRRRSPIRQKRRSCEATATEILRRLEKHMSSLFEGNGASYLVPWEYIIKFLKLNRETLLEPLIALKPDDRGRVIQILASICTKLAVWDWECEYGKVKAKKTVVQAHREEFVERIRRNLEAPYQF